MLSRRRLSVFYMKTCYYLERRATNTITARSITLEMCYVTADVKFKADGKHLLTPCRGREAHRHDSEFAYGLPTNILNASEKRNVG